MSHLRTEMLQSRCIFTYFLDYSRFPVELTGLGHGADYILTVTAESAWGKVSQPLTVSFSPPQG